MPSLAPRNLKLYRDIGRLLVRYGRSDLARYAGLDEALQSEEPQPGSPPEEEQLAHLLSANQIEIGVKAFDEQRLMKGLHRVANRIAVGVILAALIIGAALLMRVNTSFKLLGYPGLAIILFLLAAAGDVAMVISVIRTDE